MRHRQVAVREHDRLRPVLVHPLADLLGRVGAECHELNAAFIQLGAEFFPSPQLGDTVRSPMAAEELQKDGTAL